MLEPLHPPVREAWTKWLSVARERCHLGYRLEGPSLTEHIEVCFVSAQEVCERIVREVNAIAPHTILEVGCSVGFNCFTLARRYPTATVVGIEPDREAVAVASAMAAEGTSNNVAFVAAVGEGLPFRDATFDLIVCHTVIEHVGNVSSVVEEMARVLSPAGVIHLEAPNYVWPREPHLEIWCLPLFGKRLMRLFAALQGKRQVSSFLDHLQLVTPGRLERLFDRHGLEWQSHVPAKLRAAADGAHGVVKAYRSLARALRVLNRLHVSTFLLNTACAIGLYPSVMYTVRRRQAMSQPANTARMA